MVRTWMLICMFTAVRQHLYSFAVPSSLAFNEAFTSLHERISFLNSLKQLQLDGSNSLRKLENETEMQKALFATFVSLFKRSYVNDSKEEAFRFTVFQRSLLRHHLLNKKEFLLNGTAFYGINKFSDWTDEEFLAYLGPEKSCSAYSHNYGKQLCVQVDPFVFGEEDVGNVRQPCWVTTKAPPKSVDWKARGMITSVKDQKSCGSCWAFVSSEQVESYWAIAGNELTKLSAQELVSCAPSLGCSGGNTCAALKWLAYSVYQGHKLHLVPDADYPYEEADTPCAYTKLKQLGGQISAVCMCQSLVTKESIMLNVMDQKGPIAVNVDALLWRDYVAGIIQHHCSGAYLNHAVQLVAYNLEGVVPYWLARNQWGVSFGEEGFVRIKYGDNVCGVATEPSFVEV